MRPFWLYVTRLVAARHEVGTSAVTSHWTDHKKLILPFCLNTATDVLVALASVLNQKMDDEGSYFADYSIIDSRKASRNVLTPVRHLQGEKSISCLHRPRFLPLLIIFTYIARSSRTRIGAFY